ncbi:hypothetical protein [uncultured Lamprocystis sp.]|jgi:hypothetical protein|uniref:hypothetical protein n=1 Tax=uncultured Lamprocystis sp. TaxID=543132 RepID=UPI0025F3B104|nr:hypothetical protein [uncultured Lamprocystis sp.]
MARHGVTLKRILLGILLTLILLLILPEWPRIPVADATAADWKKMFYLNPFDVLGVKR